MIKEFNYNSNIMRSFWFVIWDVTFEAILVKLPSINFSIVIDISQSDHFKEVFSNLLSEDWFIGLLILKPIFKFLSRKNVASIFIPFRKNVVDVCSAKFLSHSII